MRGTGLDMWEWIEPVAGPHIPRRSVGGKTKGREDVAALRSSPASQAADPPLALPEVELAVWDDSEESDPPDAPVVVVARGFGLGQWRPGRDLTPVEPASEPSAAAAVSLFAT